MHNLILIVQDRHSFDDMGCIVFVQRFRDNPKSLSPLPQLPARRALHLEEQAQLILESAIDLGHIGAVHQFGQAVFLHEHVCLLPHSLHFGLFDLFDRIDLPITFRSGSEDYGEIARSDVLHLAKGIQSQLFLLLFAVAFGFVCLCSFADLLVFRPISLLAVSPTIINFLARGAT